MRPPRIIIVVAFLVTSAFLALISSRSTESPQTITRSPASQSGIDGFFSFRAPFSLFPPNAIITLTHENSTAFLARPAGFGPSLPKDGLKGQVWIGSGFGDEGIRQGMVVAGAEGELGCSDVPGWVDSFAKSGAATSEEIKSGDGKSATVAEKSKVSKRDGKSDADRTAVPDRKTSGKGDNSGPSADDGTDDYLHHPLTGSGFSKPSGKQAVDSKDNHADIQSIQEGAEIAGKVVLLSRGGCGFLEKVKWTQRRGGIALIVGDNTKGGPLIQMYARGDTSNVTIPAIFTSRTTAHLLSSLIGPGSFIENTIDENGKPALKVQHSDKSKKAGKKQTSNPTFTPIAAANKPIMTARPQSNKKGPAKTEEKKAPMPTQRPGWFKSLFAGSGGDDSKSDSSRPPSSGQLDWVLVDDWKDDDTETKKMPNPKQANKKAEAEKASSPKAKPGTKASAGDDFVIGVQDWRDPDLVGQPGIPLDSKSPKTGDEKNGASKSNGNSVPVKAGKKHTGGALQEIPEYNPALQGGSITPGSGEYNANDAHIQEKSKGHEDQDASKSEGGGAKGLLSTIFGDDEEDAGLEPIPAYVNPKALPITATKEDESEGDDGDDEYEGLWVTLTPTSGASPFLDTLLVLVVSPLVTLTIVYALLLVRSRIRRRRWRAPKSVVERLPVRTYQTIASGSQSPRIPSPTSSSANTPLLQSTPARPRPRSRTTTGIPEPGDLIRVNSQPLLVPAISPRPGHEHEKNASVSSEWKKFMGKQVECVVCLEEYIDGVSRVMSLPCGHEFHEDCITPWLTTRRRTCPICKGDVVRSLARGSPSSPRYEPYHDDSDDDIQHQAAETVNNSPSAAQPIPRTLEGDTERDLEQGVASPTPTRPRSARASSWRTLLASSLGSSSRSPRPSEEDRNR
ncbi:pa domain-containing protein [Phlyctema vagabunda]|uniref:Pa domain-containing protein n=1 Tax=Phlyctema vagabunda TaxID=108571 RepID=A0ABR4PRW9_9HELO